MLSAIAGIVSTLFTQTKEYIAGAFMGAQWAQTQEAKRNQRIIDDIYASRRSRSDIPK